MLKAVIFDMDGVIVDSEPSHMKALQKAGYELGLPLTMEYCTQFIGRSISYLLDKITTDFHIVTEVEAFQTSLSQLFKTYKLEFRKEGLIPIPGTIRLIQALHDHNIKVAIASSSPIEDIQDVIQTLQLEPYIDTYVSGSMVAESKPCPDIFLLACQRLDILPNEAIILEDSENGCIAAHRANIPCIGYQNPNSGNQNLQLATCVVEDTMYVDYSFLLEEYNRANGYPVEILKTKRLTIRELTIEDIPLLHALYQNPNNTAYIPTMDTLDIELTKHAAYIKHVYHFYRFGLWGVFLSDTKQLIGRCGLQCVSVDGEPEVEAGYFIDEIFQRNGYAYEAMTEILSLAKHYFELPSVIAIIHPDHIASIQLAKKLGFSYDKTSSYQGNTCHVYRIDFSN